MKTIYHVRVQFANPKTGFLETKEFDFLSAATSIDFVSTVGATDKFQVVATYVTSAYENELTKAVNDLANAAERGLE